MTDRELLEQHAREGSAEALCELIHRYASMVHATALREVGDSHLADDISQAVFLVLAQRAKSLPSTVLLGGWLFRTTQFAASRARQQAATRRKHEREAGRMDKVPEPELEATLDEARAALHEGLGKLAAPDRDVLVQRYLRGDSTQTIATVVRVPEAVVRKRLSRALERLRKVMAKRGPLLALAALIGLFDGMKAHAAPAALIDQLCGVARGSVSASPLSQTLARGVQEMHRSYQIRRTTIAVGAVLTAVLLAAAVGFALPSSPRPALAASPAPAARPTMVPVATPMAPARRASPTSAPPAAAAAQPSPSAAPLPADPALAKAISTANAHFAIDFFHQVSAKVTENVFTSPYSISAALAMTWAGARGDTAAEMSKVLYFSELKNGDVTPAFRSLQSALADAQQKTGAKLAVANSLWPDKSIALRPDYQQRIDSDFGPELMAVDYIHAKEAARFQINAWVADKTMDKVKDILNPDDVSPDTRLALVNAIYFKGSWVSEFQERLNVTGDFQAADGPKTTVLMHQTFADTSSVKYAEFADAAVPFQMISIPYLNQGDVDDPTPANRGGLQRGGGGQRRTAGDLSFVVVLPTKADGLAALEKGMTAEMFNGLFDKLAPTRVEVFLPKFRIEQRFDLKEDLRKMGINKAFVWETADFSGMSSTQLYISKVIHKTFIDVDEKGTEAAAATVVIMGRGGAPRPQAAPPVFRADHPFLFFIRENTTGSILFMGRLATPTSAH